MQLKLNGVTVDTMTVEEAEIIIANNAVKESTGFEQELLTDSVQILALGLTSLSQVVGLGLEFAKADGGFRKGVTYDSYDTAQMAYGKALAKLCTSIDSNTMVTDSLLTPLGKKYAKGRKQLEIMSDLIEEQLARPDGTLYKTGRKYFEVVERDTYISSGVVTGWKDSTKSQGLRTHRELFVQDLEAGIFTLADGSQVRLGHHAVYDWYLSQIENSGALEDYVTVLNNVDYDVIRTWKLKGDPRFTFVNIFKTINPTLVQVG